MENPAQLWLVRHGETEWSLSGQHTGRTDIPLTGNGRALAAKLKPRLAGADFAAVLASPRSRAQETCRLAGLGERMQIEPDLAEWDYGDYEGLTTNQIRERDPGWEIWTGAVPNGETLQQVAARANAVIARALSYRGKVALFAHGHILRVLGACWCELAPVEGRRLILGTGSISKLGWERENRGITLWNWTE